MNRVRNCFGLPLWKGVELWFCLSGVPPHIHFFQSFEIVPLFGFAKFTRMDPGTKIEQRIDIGPRSWFHAFTVPANWPHWFETKLLVVLNRSERSGSAAANIAYL